MHIKMVQFGTFTVLCALFSTSLHFSDTQDRCDAVRKRSREIDLSMPLDCRPLHQNLILKLLLVLVLLSALVHATNIKLPQIFNSVQAGKAQ